MNANSKIELLSEKNKARIKKHPFITGFVVLIVIIFLINTFSGSSSSTTPTPQPVAQQAQTVPTVSKEQAQKDLTDFMETAKKAKLVSSYEFSDRANEVLIDSMWYTQKVDFKN